MVENGPQSRYFQHEPSADVPHTILCLGCFEKPRTFPHTQYLSYESVVGNMANITQVIWEGRFLIEIAYTYSK